MAERATAGAPREGRPTLGLVTANVHLGVGASLWSGVLAAAERNDVNLVCLPGGPLRPRGSPRNTLYELIGEERLDGVICWTSALGLPAGSDDAARLADRLGTLPVVSLNQDLGGHETLLLDSHAGMREAVGHLVETHDRRRLACIRGPLTHPVSLDRYRAYTHAAARHRVPVDRSLVTTVADFGGGAGASAVRVLLDVRGLRPGRDFDALVACSDVLAADALRCLTERGVRVPEDVAVVGFNDSLEARLSDPPLTSVSLPFAELGALAVDTLVARLRGTRPPARNVVPGTLVTRRSCGCHSPLVTQGRGPLPPSPAPVGADGAFAAFPRAAGEIAAAFHADVDATGAGTGAEGGGRGDGAAFLPLLEALIGTEVRTFDDAAVWDGALLRARDLAVPLLPPPGRARAERLFGQARLMVADKSHRLLEYERWAEEQESRRLRDLGTTLTTTTDLDALTGALARHLPGTGVPGCRLVLYGDGAAIPGAGDGGGLARAVLRPEERADPAARGAAEPYPVGRVLPDALLPAADRRFTLVAEPLHIGDERLGYVLFDASPGHGAAQRGPLYRALGDQISAALKGIRLFDEVRRARDAAEQANRLKTRLLDNATGELRTPVEALVRHTRPPSPAAGAGRDPAAALRSAHADAGRLLRLIDDLLDLSRAEIDALDLSRCLIDPRPLLAEAVATAAGADPDRRVVGRLPRRLPAISADGPRLRQIVLHLLTAAAALTTGPVPVTLTADVRPPVLSVHITGPPDMGVPSADASGSRLSLAIARRLAVLHGGAVTLGPDRGGPPGFRLELPLPTPADAPGAPPPADGTRTLFVASAGAPPGEVTALARRHGLPTHRLHPDEDVASLLERHTPAAVAWDVGQARPHEWGPVRRLYDHPACRHVPFLLYGPVQGRDLGRALGALRPAGPAEPALVVDGDPVHRERLRRLLTGVLPGRPVRTAVDGASATALLAEELPCLLVVSRELTDPDGFTLVERVYETAAARRLPVIPVLMVSGHGFTADDVRRAEPYPALVLLGRDILTDDELTGLLTTLTRRTDPAALRAHGPVRHALAHIEQHYREPLSRRQIAQRAGVSENHLGRLFHRELGLTLWDYLTRLRIRRAKERLRRSDESVQAVARAVGFHDRAYFSRVFRKVTGVAPHVYREAS
ncbi:substrate-binding domain-containing protein [Streptomyces sp. NPDC006368]|uniref:substrate-binding domain-containing protein n=1 Tax=Streptomyces sp. NPDC006368 TaxID=3156760 RepID=UPI0033A9ABD9